ncbi:MAG: RdgB/HAM1 family non-canonical purine NTP pyrophosphatase [Candidatus Ranarchaeia archaeon]
MKKSSRSPLTFCTSNRNKFEEAKDLLSTYNIDLIHHKVSLPEIQADQVASIALFSARNALRDYPHPLIVEDTGLYIEELKGFPGPYAAYVENTIGNSGIIKIMKNIVNRKAEFRTAVAFIQPDHAGHVVEGRVSGRITESIRHGTRNSGWGYDPIFVPDGAEETYAEMGQKQKNLCSHRHHAFTLFAEWYINNVIK